MGEAFVGDLAISQLPVRFIPGLPIFAEDMEQVKQSCRLLLGLGAKTIYPAHGRPFAADILRTAVTRAPSEQIRHLPDDRITQVAPLRRRSSVYKDDRGGSDWLLWPGS
jgi:glyoxylase-like metal-dependent hydrolase (beta-lactamase superfamily II)